MARRSGHRWCIDSAAPFGYARECCPGPPALWRGSRGCGRIGSAGSSLASPRRILATQANHVRKDARRTRFFQAFVPSPPVKGVVPLPPFPGQKVMNLLAPSMLIAVNSIVTSASSPLSGVCRNGKGSYAKNRPERHRGWRENDLPDRFTIDKPGKCEVICERGGPPV